MPKTDRKKDREDQDDQIDSLMNRLDTALKTIHEKCEKSNTPPTPQLSAQRYKKTKAQLMALTEEGGAVRQPRRRLGRSGGPRDDEADPPTPRLTCGTAKPPGG